MQFNKTKLAGLIEIEPVVFGDDRGFFMETYQCEEFRYHGLDLNFRQDNLSSSVKDTVRGLHYQHPGGQGKLISVVHGAVFDVAVDIRKGSPTFGEWQGIELSAENRKLLWVPVGFAHGFAVLTDTAVFSYKCTRLYNAQHEHSVLWNDPKIGIEWPCQNPVISEKDAAGKCLADIADSDLPEYDLTV